MAAARFLFVHGAWHGAWSFDLLRLELDRRAVACETIDLPALGDDATPCADATFDAGIERIVGKIGTSGKVRSVVYLAAYVPKAGDGFAEVDAVAPATKAFRKCLTKDEAARALALDAAKAKDLLYHDVAAGIAAAAVTRLKPQPLEPYGAAKIGGTAEALAKIPRSAIIAEEDRVLAPAAQVALAERAGVPFEKVPTGHCPFLSAPKRIADLLLGVK
jgi:pimeloyl-ACP methyl ester carboxylesterase